MIFGDWMEDLLNKILGMRRNVIDPAHTDEPSWHGDPVAGDHVKHYQVWCGEIVVVTATEWL